MKRLIQIAVLCLTMPVVSGQTGYTPSPENMEARQWFQDAKFGLFIHWGVYATLGSGEWVMNNRKIPIRDYEKLPAFFNPVAFDPAEWVSLVKATGMKYICITSKHHDGFAMYHSRVSDYNVVEKTPYGKDIIGMLAAECQKQGIKLFLYYSQLDWHHPDYFPLGRTGQTAGRADSGNFTRYLVYMDAQVQEILTQYGPIGGIWFDGWWDKKWQDWQLDRTYRMIHELQPACLIGNNHHVKPFPGEDFQMFEKDLPGKNTTGFAAESEVSSLPLETCETMLGSGSWGYDFFDQKYKDAKGFLKYLIRAAGYNSNFLLNVGPMPNGKIQPEFIKTLSEIGEWMNQYGSTIYGTRGGPFPPRTYGVSTQKGNTIYLHILDWQDPVLALPATTYKIKSARVYGSNIMVPFTQSREALILTLPKPESQVLDHIIQLDF